MPLAIVTFICTSELSPALLPAQKKEKRAHCAHHWGGLKSSIYWHMKEDSVFSNEVIIIKVD